MAANIQAQQSKEAVLERCSKINEGWDALVERGLYPFHRTFDDFESGHVRIGGESKLMSGSYSYSGLSNDPRLRAAVIEAIDKYGVSSHGSRALTGSMAIHAELETNLATFLGSESATIFSNGYITNYTTISTLLGPGDTIITDRTNHNSIAAGVKASGANIETFDNASIKTLEDALKNAAGQTTLIVADAVFSMEGTILPLPEVVELSRKYGALLMVDEAHSFGVLGDTGRGIVEHFGLSPEDVDLRMGTMSKTLNSVGGFIAADTEITKALSRGADGYLFTAAQPVALVAAALETLRILTESPEIVLSLRDKSNYFRDLLAGIDLEVLGADTPIVPVVYSAGDAIFEITDRLLAEGVFVVPAVYPAVSRNAPRLRFSVTDDHSYADLDYMADTFIRLHKELSETDENLIDLTS